MKKPLNLETLKNEHPELYNQVLNAGAEYGAEQERNRIKALNELMMPGNEAQINKAKYETLATAEQTAMDILTKQRNNRQTPEQLGDQIAEIINRNRGGKKMTNEPKFDNRQVENSEDLGRRIADIINENRKAQA